MSVGSGDDQIRGLPLDDLDRRLTDATDELIDIARRLVQEPSENRSPAGDERAAQLILAEYLRSAGIQCDLFTPDEVEGLGDDPRFVTGRDYAGRPNLVATVPGVGGGRSLMLSGHVDTVGRGPRAWVDGDPFSGAIRQGQLFGRGAYDMKAALAGFAVVLKVVATSGIPMRGDLLFESVVDEEHCGGNGTLASRVRGYRPDAIMIGEQTDLAILPATKGGRVFDITLRGESGHSSDPQDANLIRGAAELIRLLAAFDASGEPRPTGDWYPEDTPPYRVTLANIASNIASDSWDIGSLDAIVVTLVVLSLPAIGDDEVDHDLRAHIAAGRDASALLQRLPPPEIRARSRFVQPSSERPDSPIVLAAANAYRAIRREAPVIRGAEFCCDAGLCAAFGIPTVLFGPRGGNAHRPDEFVDLRSLVEFVRTVGRLALEWCGEATAVD